MRVAYFADVVELGGAELSLVDYFRSSASLPLETLLVTPREGPLTVAARAVGADCRVVRMPELAHFETNPNVFKATRSARARAAYFASASRSLWRLAAALRRWRVDVLHTNGLRAHLYGVAAGRLAGCHVVWHIRDIIVKPWQVRLFRESGRMVDAVICVSEPARLALAAGPPLASKAVTIHNAIHLDTYHASAEAIEGVRAELRLSGHFPVVAQVGQVTPNKGQADLLAAAPRVLAQHPQARFVVVGQSLMGEHAYAAGLREQAASLGIQDAVVFAGFRRDVAAVLGASDVAVTPSWQEPYPRTVMEAMAAGVPVVATRVGGIPELVQDGVTGLLVAPHQPDELADGIMRAVEMPLRERLARAGNRLAHESCGVEAELARIAAVYERILHAPSGSLGGRPSIAERVA